MLIIIVIICIASLLDIKLLNAGLAIARVLSLYKTVIKREEINIADPLSEWIKQVIMARFSALD